MTRVSRGVTARARHKKVIKKAERESSRDKVENSIFAFSLSKKGFS